MDTLSKIVLIACILAIAISILNTLYPSKKFEKQVHLIFSLIFLIGVLTPIVTGSVQLSIPTANTFDNNQSYQDMQNNINATYKTTIESNISKSLSNRLVQNKINVKEISTKVNIAEDNSISISEVNIACNSLDNNEEILNLVKSEVGQEVNVVIKQGE